MIKPSEISHNKRNPKNYTKSTLSIATWNVTSLVSNSSKLNQLSTAMDAYKINILGVTETHMPHSGETCLENGDLLLYSGREDDRHSEGVGIVLSSHIKGSLIAYTPHSSRIISARLHSKHANITFIVAYAPTEVSSKTQKETFYKELEASHRNIPRGDVRILVGDFNAQVGRDHETWKGIIGTHSLHPQQNDNGTRLLDFCCLNEYVIGGTMFEHKDIHKGIQVPSGHQQEGLSTRLTISVQTENGSAHSKMSAVSEAPTSIQHITL